MTEPTRSDHPRSTVGAAPPAPPGFEGWRAFLVAHSIVTRRLDDELQREHAISLSEYDALLQLAAAEDRTLRMSALAERVLLSRSGMTRLVDRLVAAGYVERVPCPTDARGSLALITPSGLDALRGASATHLRGIRDHFLDALDERALAGLTDALERVAAHASTPGTGRPVR